MDAVDAGILCGLALFAPVARAQWLEGTITEIRAYPDASSSPLSYPVVIVYATLVPSPGCTYSAFLLLPSDAMYKETYVTLLTAKAAGAKIKYLHAYCHTSGFARGNGYSISQ